MPDLTTPARPPRRSKAALRSPDSDRAPRRHIILISGKDSLATALVQTTRRPDLPYEYVFNDVGTELPETYEWLDRVEAQTGWTIQRIGFDLTSLIESYGGFLPSHNSRYCTRLGKIKPLEDFVGDGRATLYIGLRGDEDRKGYVTTRRNIQAAYPLRADDQGWPGIDLAGVYSILEARDLLPPNFEWPALRDAVARKLGGEAYWTGLFAPWEERLLFSGRTRANCSFCFFQRKYEWTWLLDTHPDLFWKAESHERRVVTAGKDFERSPQQEMYGEPPRAERVYTWAAGERLVDLALRRDERLEERAAAVAAHIARRKHPPALFEGHAASRLEGEDPFLQTVSCGLLCGK